MFGSLLHKEWVKLRMLWLAALVVNLGVVTYVFVAMRKLFRLDHAEMVWYRVIHLGQMFYDPFMYVPLLTGLFLATTQFLPEMRNQRFRISLHLPVPTFQIVLGHVLVGLVMLLAILCADCLLLWSATLTHFPWEIANRTLLTILPWCLAGITGYLGGTLVLLEPAWKLRFVNALVAAGISAMLLQKASPGAYAHVLAPMALLVLLFMPSVLLPAYRFRYRRG